ncbi:MAG: hypothetical protein SNJ74_05120 [Fimbriimonadaceae bacterium]
MTRPFLAIALFCAVGAGVWLGTANAATQAAGQATPEARSERTFGEPRVVVRLAEKEIDESSGVAASRVKPGWFYTHNDSGDGPRFWRFDLSGNVEGPWTLVGAQAVDWEDMAVATVDGRNLVFIGDIGDNRERRPSVQVYRFEEPTGPPGPIANFDTFDLTYPDRPHNAEALLVDPRGAITIVTKNDGPSKVFTLSAGTEPGRHSLRFVADLTLPTDQSAGGYRLVTGGDVSPDGRFVVLRTYREAWEFDVAGAPTSWVAQAPRRIRLATELQGEAIAYSVDGSFLITTSEMIPCQVTRIDIRGR